MSSLRCVVHCAALCLFAVKQRMIDWPGSVVHEYYAVTEVPGKFVTPKTWLTKPGTVGTPRPEGRVIVGDEDAKLLEASEIGLV